ncbi:MAG: glycerate kinase [Lentisphaerae bacterium]|nr:glycerate kinase [Lentisphaerota bacterium]
MKIVVALDSFKGSLTAIAACEAVAAGLHEARPDVEIVIKPMADGGEGTAAALLAARPNGNWVEQVVTGPLPGQQVKAGFAWFPDTHTAVVEMAAASGLPLLKPQQRNPTRTTTHGTGELIAAACNHGARHIILTIGGSATVDGGIGAAAALGWQFLDSNANSVTTVGGSLNSIAAIKTPPATNLPPMTVLCDVTTTLCGPNGAAALFGPQKGATPDQVELLDRGLYNLARLIKESLNIDILTIPGGGAAGGLGAAAVAFFNAHLTPGSEAIINASGLHDALRGASWCITGEGCLDTTSLEGKVVQAVTNAARAAGVSVTVFSGINRLPPTTLTAAGISCAQAIKQKGISLNESLQRAPELLRSAAHRWALQTLPP